MQPDAPGDGRQFLKLCGLFVVTLALCHTDPHVGGVKQTKIIIFYEEPECLQSPGHHQLTRNQQLSQPTDRVRNG